MTRSWAVTMGALLGAAMLGGCGAPQEEQEAPEQGLTWEQFRDQAVYEPEYDVYVFDGDTTAEGLGALREYYEQYVRVPEYAQARGELCVYVSGGQDVKWTPSQALNLTYCVSTKFGGNYAAVVSAMNQATAAWEAAANVNFIHVSSQDADCNARNTSVVFDVSPTGNGSYLARAFFPNSSRRSRNILVSRTSFGNISPWTLTGVLRHELGHTLGFRHEHTRPEAGVCFEDNQWRALTPYDSSSVMHYPQCNGTQTGDLVLTTLDRSGAASLYP